MNKYFFKVYRCATIVCRNQNGKFLCFKQANKSGWQLPGGNVDLNETFISTALKQCKQQTNILVNIKGMIKVTYGKYHDDNSFRCIYYAQPTQENQNTKNVDSKRSQFFSIQQILNLKKQWRDSEVYQLPKYVQDGGIIHPLLAFQENYKQLQFID